MLPMTTVYAISLATACPPTTPSAKMKTASHGKPQVSKPVAQRPPVVPVGTVIRMVRVAARDVGVPERFALAIMLTESAGQSDAISTSCAKGPMQLLPGTAKDWGVRNIDDARQNVTGGVRYIAWLRARYHGDLIRTAAAYNAGPGKVDQYHGVPPFAETKHYVPTVLAKCIVPTNQWDGSNGSGGVKTLGLMTVAMNLVVKALESPPLKNKTLKEIGKCR